MGSLNYYEYFNIALDVWGIIFIFIWNCTVVLNRELTKDYRCDFLHLFTIVGASLLNDGVSRVFDGVATPLGCVMTHVSNYLLLFFNFAGGFIFSIYLCRRIGEMDGMDHKRIYQITGLIGVFGLVLVTLNLWTGWVYSFDANNLYQRGSLDWLVKSSGILVILVNLYLVVIRRKWIDRITLMGFLLYLIAPMLSLILLIHFTWINWFALTLVAVLMIVFMNVQRTSASNYRRQEQELIENRSKMMISQIRPHFLYNSLNSIYVLCGINPPLAQKAISNFSDYLRLNLDSLSKKFVPFEEELNCVKLYADMEKLRFFDRLEVVYDISCSNFVLPVLTIQPLVENAIKHGICNREAGGTVWLATREEVDGYVISVSDNGIGFDVADVQSDSSKNHVGLENIKERLWVLSRARLEIKSVPGYGTRAVVKIPKKEVGVWIS